MVIEKNLGVTLDFHKKIYVADFELSGWRQNNVLRWNVNMNASLKS